MASLAGMLKARGHYVTGSDAAAYPPMSVQLAATGIEVFQPYDAANLRGQAGTGGGGQCHFAGER